MTGHGWSPQRGGLTRPGPVPVGAARATPTDPIGQAQAAASSASLGRPRSICGSCTASIRMCRPRRAVRRSILPVARLRASIRTARAERSLGRGNRGGGEVLPGDASVQNRYNLTDRGPTPPLPCEKRHRLHPVVPARRRRSGQARRCRFDPHRQGATRQAPDRWHWPGSCSKASGHAAHPRNGQRQASRGECGCCRAAPQRRRAGDARRGGGLVPGYRRVRVAEEPPR